MGERLNRWAKHLRDWVGSFWKEWKFPIMVVLLFLLAFGVLRLLVLLGWIGSGFELWIPPEAGAERPKTAWDIADLCLVPAILAAGAALFTWWTNRRQQQVEMDRARDEALQVYLDAMSELVNQGHIESEQGDGARTVARARTLTLLRQLDGERQALVVQFLYESGMVGGRDSQTFHKRQALVDLDMADLNGAHLRRAELMYVDLSGAHLRGADLRGASLYGADLEGADLRGADLRSADLLFAVLDFADLSEANLSGADLYGAEVTGTLKKTRLLGAMLQDADFSEADLTEADLSEADLHGACLVGGSILYRATLTEADMTEADLRLANLSEANLTNANLSEANLEGADLTRANLAGANLYGANLSEAKITREQLAKTQSVAGANPPRKPGQRLADAMLFLDPTVPEAKKPASDPPRHNQETSKAEPDLDTGRQNSREI